MKRRWFLFGTAGLFTVDQFLKSYVEQNLDKNEERKLAGPVVMRRVSNRGMCCGLLSERRGIVRTLSLTAAGKRILEKESALPLIGRRMEQYI